MKLFNILFMSCFVTGFILLSSMTTVYASSSSLREKKKFTKSHSVKLVINEVTTDFEEAIKGFPVYKQLNKKMSEEEFIKNLKAVTQNFHLYYGYKGKEIVGLITFAITSDNLYWGKHGHICSLVIDEKNRKKGFASQLLEFVINKYSKLGISKIGLETDRYSKENNEFYQKRGFKYVANEYNKYTEKQE